MLRMSDLRCVWLLSSHTHIQRVYALPCVRYENLCSCWDEYIYKHTYTFCHTQWVVNLNYGTYLFLPIVTYVRVVTIRLFSAWRGPNMDNNFFWIYTKRRNCLNLILLYIYRIFFDLLWLVFRQRKVMCHATSWRYF